MKNKLMTLACLSLFTFSSASAQETMAPVETPAATEKLSPEDVRGTDNLINTGNKAIDYDLNSLKPVDNLPVNDTPLNKPHVSKEEITDWTMNALTDVLTNQAQGLTGNLERNKSNYTDEGYEDLIGFVRSNRITNANLLENKNISVINLQKPGVVNEGDVQGTYRWLLNIPLIISKVDPTVAASTATPAERRKLMDEMAKNNSEHILKVQVVRVKEPNGTPYNTAIEMILEEKPAVKQPPAKQ